MVAATGTDRTDQGLGQGQNAGVQPQVTRLGQQPRCPLMVDVGGVQMSNEHTGVEDNHAGQSARSWSR